MVASEPKSDSRLLKRLAFASYSTSVAWISLTMALTLVTRAMSVYWWKLATRCASSPTSRSNCACSSTISFWNESRSAASAASHSSCLRLSFCGHATLSHRAENSAASTGHCSSSSTSCIATW